MRIGSRLPDTPPHDVNTRQFGQTKIHRTKGSWTAYASYHAAKDVLSAVGAAYAQDLAAQRPEGAPLGIVEACLGGTSLRVFMPPSLVRETERECPPKRVPVDGTPLSAVWQEYLSPTRGLGVSGMVWSQGENNHKEPHVWTCGMRRFVPLLRRWWRSPFKPFPVAVVAVAGSQGSMLGIRTAQEQLHRFLPAVHTVASMDTAWALHPKRTIHVGRRVASLVDALHYGNRSAHFQAPQLQRATGVRLGGAHPPEGQEWAVQLEFSAPVSHFQPVLDCRLDCDCKESPFQALGRDGAWRRLTPFRVSPDRGAVIASLGKGIHHRRPVVGRFLQQDPAECLLYDPHQWPVQAFNFTVHLI